MSHRVIPGGVADVAYVTAGTGTGGRRLTAFDAALQDAGVHDVNLIRISSITPEGADVRAVDPGAIAEHLRPGAYHPAVYARCESETPGERVHAAVAGARLAAGYGINVEHRATDANHSAMHSACREMLEEMAARRGTEIVGDPWFRHASRTVPDDARWAGAVATMLYA